MQWDAPVSQIPIAAYEVEYGPLDGADLATIQTFDTSNSHGEDAGGKVELQHVVHDHDLEVKVRAKNSVGWGPWSLKTVIMTSGATVPVALTQFQLASTAMQLMERMRVDPEDAQTVKQQFDIQRAKLMPEDDSTLQNETLRVISNSISKWEPRIAVRNIEVSSTVDSSSLDSDDDGTEKEHILFIRIIFVDPQNIKEVQELTLEMPLT